MAGIPPRGQILLGEFLVNQTQRIDGISNLHHFLEEVYDDMELMSINDRVVLNEAMRILLPQARVATEMIFPLPEDPDAAVTGPMVHVTLVGLRDALNHPMCTVAARNAFREQLAGIVGDQDEDPHTNLWGFLLDTVWIMRNIRIIHEMVPEAAELYMDIICNCMFVVPCNFCYEYHLYRNVVRDRRVYVLNFVNGYVHTRNTYHDLNVCSDCEHDGGRIIACRDGYCDNYCYDCTLHLCDECWQHHDCNEIFTSSSDSSADSSE